MHVKTVARMALLLFSCCGVWVSPGGLTGLEVRKSTGNRAMFAKYVAMRW
jgi:hypothetical protein